MSYMFILRKYYLLFATICVFLLCSFRCESEESYYDPYDVRYSVENNDSDVIYVAQRTMPVTTADQIVEISPGYVFRNKIKLNAIPPGERVYDFTCGRLEHNYFTDKMDTVAKINHIIVFKKETMDRYSQKELAEKNIYDALYVLTTQEILDMDRVVKFPLETQGE